MRRLEINLNNLSDLTNLSDLVVFTAVQF